MTIAAAINADEGDEEIIASATALAAELAVTDAAAAPQIEDVYDEDLRIASLRSRLHQQHLLSGLPPYRSASGEEVPALESPLLSELSLCRYLRQSQWDVDASADAIKETLSWRRSVLPSDAAAAKAARATALLEDGRILRFLGPNRDGDHVVAIDFCWGHLFTEDALPLDVMRTLLLGAEAAIEKADADGHPQLVVVSFGGPAPCEIARALYRCFEKHFPNRLKTAVIYPVPRVLAKVAHGCLAFVSAPIRQKISVAVEEEEVVEGARLTSAEQLPEDWRGGIDRVTELHQPSYSLLNRMVLKYLSPLPSFDESLEEALQRPWHPAEDATEKPRRQESAGFLGFFGSVMGVDYD